MQNIEAAKREVLRLLDQTRKVLKDVVDRPDLLHEPDPKQPRQLTTHEAEEWLSVLSSEIKKVDSLEVIFAVIGTVNAGKSTTINAIVGAEILPNRPEPMTTYPTLIRHNLGQIEPVLNFPVARNCNALVRRAKKTLEKETEIPLDEQFPDPHKQEIARKVLEGKLKVESRYEGRAEVLDLLRTVNDLYRLCGQLKLELPKTVTSTSNHLPNLEIEMQHIGASDTGVGQFSVLDLPGPNEFGQSERLREIVQTQLPRASAVVLVSDFTQLNTDADNAIRNLVENELAWITDHLFIFVNKFDQRRADDWNEKSTREYLSKTLLDGTVAPERIYPVSARKAFLANWARREMKNHRRLPRKGTSLTEDFGKEAFGDMWEEFINNPELARKGVDRVWEKSYFSAPLDNMVRVAARRAPFTCFRTATAKLLECNQTLDSFLKTRDGATTKDVEELQKEIENLQGDIGKISKKKETSEGRIKARLDEFPEIVRVGCEGWSKQLRQVIEQYLKTGKVSPPPQGWLKATFRKALDHLDQWVPERFKNPLYIPAQTRPDFSPRQSREFRGSDHADKAQKFIKPIRARIELVYYKAASQIEQRLNEILEKLSNRITTDVEEELRDILEKAQKRLKRGFQVTLDFPKLELNIDIAELEGIDSSVVKQASESRRTGRKKKTHLFAPVTRFFGEIFGEDWGYDAVYKEQQISTINLATLQDAAMKELEHFSSKMQSHARDLAQSQEEAVSSYFDNLKEYLEAFRGDLLDALGDKHRKTDDLTELHNKLLGFLSEVEDVLHDTQKFNESLEASDGAERSIHSGMAFNPTLLSPPTYREGDH